MCHGKELPIQSSVSKASGRTQLQSDYPVNGLIFHSDAYADIWPAVCSLQSQDIPFNLIYLEGQFVLVPRDDNNEVVREFANILASMEICGKFIFSDRKSFEKATASRIMTAFGRIRLSYDDFV